MGEALRDQMAALGDEVRAAALPDDCQHTALWCVGQLPALYAQYCLTNAVCNFFSGLAAPGVMATLPRPYPAPWTEK
jgi:hypothetical protein